MRRRIAWTSCVGKTRYHTLKLAQWSASLRSAVSGDTITAYRCLRCRRFHIGHSQAVGIWRDKPWLYDGNTKG